MCIRDRLKEEINADRKAHGKKSLKDDNHKDDEDDSAPPTEERKEQKQSETDPESGWFHKGEHKEVFAYAIETACDENGWILDYTCLLYTSLRRCHSRMACPKLLLLQRKDHAVLIRQRLLYLLRAMADDCDDAFHPRFFRLRYDM